MKKIKEEKEIAEKKKKKRSLKKVKIPKDVIESIPYDGMLENGLIQTEPGVFTKSYQLDDINFKKEDEENQEKIVLDYGTLLNVFDQGMTAQVSIINRSVDRDLIKNNILLKPQKDNLNRYREEVNSVILRDMAKGKNNLSQEKYLTVSVEATNEEMAQSHFARLDSDINRNLRKITKKDTRPVQGKEMLGILHDIYNPDSDLTFDKKIKDFLSADKDQSLDLRKLARRGLLTKDLIAPMSFGVFVDHLKIDDIYSRTLLIDNYPTFLKCDVLPDLASINANLIASVTYKFLLPNDALKLVKRQRTNISANVVQAEKNATKGGYSVANISPELRRSMEEAEELLSDVRSRNQKVIFATTLVTVFARSRKELNELTDSVKSMAISHLCQAKTLYYMQEAGFNSSLPLGSLKVDIDRLLTTESASAFIPFSSQELNHKKGIYYGLNLISNNLIFYDRLSSENYNGMIFGKPGSGKSFFAKEEINQVALGTNDAILIIDPQNEYGPDIIPLGGEVLDITTGSLKHLNPLDMDMQYAGEGKDPIAMKCDFLVSMCETVAGYKYGLSPGQINSINRCGRKIYDGYLAHMKPILEANEGKLEKDKITIDRNAMPTFLDFYTALVNEDNPEAQALALALEQYANGNYDLFSYRTNFDSKARIRSYNTKDLPSNIKELGYQVCLNDAWNTIIENKKKGIRTWLYIDEMHMLMSKESTVLFLKEIFKLARKWGGIPTGITQNAEDVLVSAEARTMIQNCDFVVVMNQSAPDRSELAALYGISDTLLEYITDQSFGTGLIYNGKTIVPFINEFDENTELYRFMSTKPTEAKTPA